MIALITSVVVLFAISLYLVLTNRRLKENLKSARKMSDKHLALYLLMNQWVRQKNHDKSVSNYLLKNGYMNIAIYGFNYIGETLYDELKKSDVNVSYALDKNADHIFAEVKVYKPEDNVETVDAIIVTAFTAFSSIEAMLNPMFSCPILSLEDILYDL